MGIFAHQFLLLERFEVELLAADRGIDHQSALGHDKHGHAFFELAVAAAWQSPLPTPRHQGIIAVLELFNASGVLKIVAIPDHSSPPAAACTVACVSLQ